MERDAEHLDFINKHRISFAMRMFPCKKESLAFDLIVSYCSENTLCCTLKMAYTIMTELVIELSQSGAF